MENNYIIPTPTLKYKYVKGCFFFTHQLLYSIIASVILSQIPYYYTNVWQLSILGTITTFITTLLVPFTFFDKTISICMKYALPLINLIYICMFSSIPSNIIVYYKVNHNNIFYLNIYNICSLLFLMFYKWFCNVNEYNQYMRVATSINV